nr:hypothetical protein [Alphaproteobacteria bacterium]
MTPAPQTPRTPKVVAADDPTVELVSDPKPDDTKTAHVPEHDSEIPAVTARPTAPVKTGIKWGAILLSAMAGLAALAAALSFSAFVANVITRDDWIGWLGFGLAVIA